MVFGRKFAFPIIVKADEDSAFLCWILVPLGVHGIFAGQVTAFEIMPFRYYVVWSEVFLFWI